MGDIEKRTRLARLLIAPPKVVYDELRDYGAEVRDGSLGTASDNMESMLAARNDRLIDLAIASFGASRDQLRQLYEKAKAPAVDDADEAYKQGVRLAVLGNETAASKSFLQSFPVGIIGDEELARVLREGDWHEAETLVENRTVADDVLLALYRGEGPADGMDDERRRQLVAYTGRNPRLQHRDDSEFGPDLGHWDLHKAIFAMLETVPTSKGWMQCLDFLLKQIDPHDACHPASVDHVLERWAVDESGKPPEPDKGHEYNDSGLDDRTEFRCLVSSLYGQIHSVGGRVEGSPDDEDVVRRCAYYGNARLDQKQMAAGFEKDGDVFVFAAMANDNLLLNRANRKFFEDECLTGRQLYRYKRQCAQLKRRWPSFDPRPTAEWMTEPAKEPQSELSEIRQQLAELSGQVSSLSKAATWLPWLIGGTAALVMWRS